MKSSTVLFLFLGYLLVLPTFAAPKTLIYCSEGSPSGFNPQLVTDGTSFNASSRTLYDRLVGFRDGQTTLEPRLAESWKISKDGKKYTFKLRPNVFFHSTETFKPSRPLKADDVVFTFERMLKKDHPFHKVSGGGYEYFESMDFGKLIRSVAKIDDLTVEFTLGRSESPFLADLAMDFASILSSEYADQMMKAGKPEKVDTDPVGTGPFQLVKYVKDNQIRFKAFDQHFRGRAKIDQLVYAITPDPSVRFQKLKAGECHVIIEPAPADLPAMRNDSKLMVLERPGLNVAYLALATTRAPWDKREVRQAIHHALNRASYIDAIYMGNAEVAKNPIPSTIWSYHEGVKDYAYDPEMAKKLLTQAGFDFNKVYELWTMPVSRPYNPNGKKMGELMQADLSKIGVKVKLVTYDWPTYLAKSRKETTFDMIQFGWTGDNGDPDNFLNVLLSCSAVTAGSNFARWCHPKFNDLIEKARKASALEERTKLYRQAQEIFKSEAPWVTLAHSKVYRAISRKVIGYQVDPLGGDNFYQVDLAD